MEGTQAEAVEVLILALGVLQALVRKGAPQAATTVLVKEGGAAEEEAEQERVVRRAQEEALADLVAMESLTL